jgi:hypothetical protein
MVLLTGIVIALRCCSAYSRTHWPLSGGKSARSTDGFWPTAPLLSAIRSGRLGSESQVASTSLTWLHKAAGWSMTYPTAYPEARSAGLVSALLMNRSAPTVRCAGTSRR